MAELKTQRTAASVAAFLAAIPDPQRRSEAKTLASLLRKATGKSPAMWGSSIVGYGTARYQGASGREVEWFPIGFSPRKAAITVYIISGLSRQAALLGQLGPHTTGKGCLYLPKFDQVDLKVLTRLVKSGMSAGPKVTKARRTGKKTERRSS